MSSDRLAALKAALPTLSTARAEMLARQSRDLSNLQASQAAELASLDGLISIVNEDIAALDTPATDTSADPAPAESADPSSQTAPTAS